MSQYKEEKINYTAFLQNKPQETRPLKLAAMKQSVSDALRSRDVHGHISCKYYTDVHILVHVNGKYYGVFDTNKGEFFSGFVGDRR